MEYLQIRDKASIIPLVAGLRRDVLNQVSEGMALVWESYKLDPYVQKLSEVVLLFQEKVSIVTIFYLFYLVSFSDSEFEN